MTQPSSSSSSSSSSWSLHVAPNSTSQSFQLPYNGHQLQSQSQSRTLQVQPSNPNQAESERSQDQTSLSDANLNHHENHGRQQHEPRQQPRQQTQQPQNRQFACLFTKQLTQKRKRWLDGRLVLRYGRVVLYDGDANATVGAGECQLDECDMPPHWKAAGGNSINSTGGHQPHIIGQTLQTEKHIIEVTGPWDASSTSSSSSVASSATPSGMGFVKPQPLVSHGMKKVLTKKFRKAPKYIPPPPSSASSAAGSGEGDKSTTSLWQKRTRPLQPGELQRRYYGHQTTPAAAPQQYIQQPLHQYQHSQLSGRESSSSSPLQPIASKEQQQQQQQQPLNGWKHTQQMQRQLEQPQHDPAGSQFQQHSSNQIHPPSTLQPNQQQPQQQQQQHLTGDIHQSPVQQYQSNHWNAATSQQQQMNHWNQTTSQPSNPMRHVAPHLSATHPPSAQLQESAISHSQFYGEEEEDDDDDDDQRQKQQQQQQENNEDDDVPSSQFQWDEPLFEPKESSLQSLPQKETSPQVNIRTSSAPQNQYTVLKQQQQQQQVPTNMTTENNAVGEGGETMSTLELLQLFGGGVGVGGEENGVDNINSSSMTTVSFKNPNDVGTNQSITTTTTTTTTDAPVTLGNNATTTKVNCGTVRPNDSSLTCETEASNMPFQFVLPPVADSSDEDD